MKSHIKTIVAIILLAITPWILGMIHVHFFGTSNPINTNTLQYFDYIGYGIFDMLILLIVIFIYAVIYSILN